MMNSLHENDALDPISLYLRLFPIDISAVRRRRRRRRFSPLQLNST